VNSSSYLGRWLSGEASDGSDSGAQAGSGLLPPLRRPLEVMLTEGGERPTRRVSLSPGQVFAHYRVERELGHGAMATVYRARDERNDRLVALKLLSLGDDWPEDRLDEARLRLLREAEAATRIQHPDIVGVHEAGEHDGTVFLAMEFIEGVSLGPHT